MKYEDLERVNSEMLSTNIKGKDYVEVNQRIKAFRKLYPEGTIETEMLSNENGVCVFKARVMALGCVLGTGHAYEKEDSSFINKTSYIENCETSAVGRALGMLGLGVDTSVASAEEVRNAINNQDPTLEEAEKWTFPFGKHKGKTYREVIETNSQYVKWYLSNKASEYDIKCYELLTGEKVLTEEESMEKITLMSKLSDLVFETDTDYAALLRHYEVESNNEMTIEQLKEAIKTLEGRLANGDTK